MTSTLLTEAHRRLVVHVLSSASLNRVRDFFLLLFSEDLRKSNKKQTVNSVMSVRLSVCPSVRNNSVPTSRIFIKLDKFSIYRKPVEKIQVQSKSDKNNRYFIRRSVYIYDNISFISSQDRIRVNLRETYGRQTVAGKGLSPRASDSPASITPIIFYDIH